MTAQEVLNAVKEPTAYDGAPSFWDEAMAAMPAGILPFLEPSVLSARRMAAGLPADRDELLVSVAATVASDPALQQLAWYLHWRVFVAPEKGSPWGAPSLITRLGEQAGAFYLLLMLEFAPRLYKWYRQLGYPREVTEHTIRQVSSFESNHIRGRGRPGVYENQYCWLVHYFVHPYVRLGRFEYEMSAYGGGVSVWKRIADGRVLALAENGARVADNGLLLAAGAPAEMGWTARLEESADTVTGFPVDPEGRVLRTQVRLDRSQWTCCLAQGRNVLNLHIPPGGGMDWDSIVASFRQASDFFARHHTDTPIAALTVGTWFTDPQLAELLPADSNILRFQRAVYLYPLPQNAGALWFVFLRDIASCDVATLPRDTSVQRAVAGFLARGGKWHGGGMFVLAEDLASPREGLYREGFVALQLENKEYKVK